MTYPGDVPTVDSGTGTLREGGKPPKLIIQRQLSDLGTVPASSSEEGSARRSGFSRSVRFWPRAASWAGASSLVLLALSLAGCGGATAPCPTPTTELDSLRTEADHLEAEVDRETAQERALQARRNEAARRAGSAQAALDSLAGGGSR